MEHSWTPIRFKLPPYPFPHELTSFITDLGSGLWPQIMSRHPPVQAWLRSACRAHFLGMNGKMIQRLDQQFGVVWKMNNQYNPVFPHGYIPITLLECDGKKRGNLGNLLRDATAVLRSKRWPWTWHDGEPAHEWYIHKLRHLHAISIANESTVFSCANQANMASGLTHRPSPHPVRLPRAKSPPTSPPPSLTPTPVPPTRTKPTKTTPTRAPLPHASPPATRTGSPCRRSRPRVRSSYPVLLAPATSTALWSPRFATAPPRISRSWTSPPDSSFPRVSLLPPGSRPPLSSRARRRFSHPRVFRGASR